MALDWNLVKEYVKSEFPDYLSVNSIADISEYQPMKFLILKNGASFVSKWYEKPLGLFRNPLPSFDSVGEVSNFSAARSLEGGSSISLPDIDVKKLGICGDGAWNKTVMEGQLENSSPSKVQGSIKTSTMLPGLGNLSRHSVNYRELRAWIEKYWFLESSEDMIEEAKRGNVFVIHDVIMAEKLECKGETNQSISGQISSFLVKLKYNSKTSFDFRRPPDFGQYPIAYKIAKIKVRRSKHVAHASAMSHPTASSKPSPPARSIYGLKIEPLRDFSQSSRKRKFGKENSPSSGK